jgi:(E)-4-hydroxy-3-methylbut-2-enyl-diphosphate synthase
LGVTEAGDGEDGRIKSAIGIGSLLLDGIGDTIRVSLSEEPEHEIPVAKQLIEGVERRLVYEPIVADPCPAFNPFSYQRRVTNPVGSIGGTQVPVVMVCGQENGNYAEGFKPDFVLSVDAASGREVAYDLHVGKAEASVCPIYTANEFNALSENPDSLFFIKMRWSDLDALTLQRLNRSKNGVVLLYAKSLGERRAFFHALLNASCRVPVVVCVDSSSTSVDKLQLELSLDLGPLLLDGFGDGIMYVQHEASMIQSDAVCRVLFGILQATRLRISKTEYISCPGCGRTLFDLQQTITRIKSRTGHLKGLKIGIMGCIVNGPGEMADADYGYVGAGRGKVSLYKGQTCVEKNIPEAFAVDKLIKLIKQHGDWKEP